MRAAVKDVNQEPQPYLQKKGELDNDGTAKYELKVREERHEIDRLSALNELQGSGMRYELSARDSSREVRIAEMNFELVWQELLNELEELRNLPPPDL